MELPGKIARKQISLDSFGEHEKLSSAKKSRLDLDLSIMSNQFAAGGIR